MAGEILIKRGPKSNLPTDADLGELLFVTDTEELYIGNGVGSPLTQLKSKNKFGAVIDPSSNDDSNLEYSIGSLWINELTDKFFVCVDNAAGAAMWQNFVLSSEVGVSIATLVSGKVPESQLPSLMQDPLLNPIPMRGTILPLSTSRAYYEKILASVTPIFSDGSTTHKYIAYYGNGTNNFVAYSNDGIAWSGETVITGVIAGYHCEVILVGITAHLFYWDTASTIYSPAAIRHATIDTSVNSNVAISDAPLSGNYITGVYADGLRNGTYGVDKAFYNASPTNDPINPYTYQWCIIHNGTDGSNEGELFATSSDGYNFSAWNGNNEVIPRGLGWDKWIGNIYAWKEGSNWYAYYSGGLGTSAGSDTNFGDGIGFATSTDGINWTKNANNPIMFKTFSNKSAKRLYCPCIVKTEDGWTLYYTVKDTSGLYRVASAIINRLS